MAAILDTDLTEGKVTGSGVFDLLMKATKAHLDAEYQAGRIAGADYATVYLGSLQAVMQQSVAYLLGKQQADKQAELLAAQAAKVADEQALVQQQTTNLGAELANIGKLGTKLDAETALVNQQVTNLVSEELLIDSRKAKTDQEIQNLIAEADKAAAEKALLDQRLLNEITNNTTLVKQQTKLDAETDVLTERKWNEQAQRLDTVNGLTVAGTLGKQKALYQAQTDGFARDAEQKLLKAMVDTWSIRRSTDVDTDVVGTGLTNPDIQDVVDKARAGIGLGASAP